MSATPRRQPSPAIPGTPQRATSANPVVLSPNRVVANKSEDISVVCRVRPLINDEAKSFAVKVAPPNTIEVVSGDNNNLHEFSFDHVLGPETTQSTVFEKIGRPVVDCVMDGFNATIFAYGQTSAGKTHTMVGTPQDPGIVFRFAQELFERIAASPPWLEYSVQTQYVEIYLEKVRDLLEDRSQKVGGGGLMRQNLQIREDPTRGVHIPDATTKYVCTAQELLDVCEMASSHRATSETLMNQVSSRSHSVLLLLVTQKDVNTGAVKTSKINLVDLAGSEAVKRSGAEGERLTEAQAINSSLSALGNVIHALTKNEKTTYVPYRDSKLTRLLQESLGGNAKTWLVVNVSPSSINSVESLSTLRFGQRAKSVKNKAVVNQMRSAQELEEALKRAEEIIAQQEATILLLRKGNHKTDSNQEEEEEQHSMGHLEEEKIQLEIKNRVLEERNFVLEAERDEARQGWEHSREEAALMESEYQKQIQDLKTRLESSLMRVAELELTQPATTTGTQLDPMLLTSSFNNTNNNNVGTGLSSSPLKNNNRPTNGPSEEVMKEPQIPTRPQVSPTTPKAQAYPTPQQQLEAQLSAKKLASELRLDQLVQVHRQLLRKYAHLELVVTEAKQALAVGDERVRVLTRELAAAQQNAAIWNNNNGGGGSVGGQRFARVAKVVRGGNASNISSATD